MYQAAIIIISDKGAAGLRKDLSGPAIQTILERKGWEISHQSIIPDSPEQIQNILIDLCDSGKADLIITSGGTGFSPRDNTPEATLAIAEKEAPGVAEAFRRYSLEDTEKAILSRGVCVIRKGTIILNLPGNPKSVHVLERVLGPIRHGSDILQGRAGEHSDSH
jgi:molybdenum cofactor synthesis domain-containing protein